MSMTLWVQILEGRQVASHEDDHNFMNGFMPELDTICRSLGVAPLSSFLDSTDLNANISEDEVDDDLGEMPLEEVDPETGLSYGIDDMTWFPAQEGLSVLTSLRSHLNSNNTSAIPQKMLPALLDELDSCISKLKEPASRDAKFHFAMVM